jgi:uncharacterized protein (TIGR03663 family)
MSVQGAKRKRARRKSGAAPRARATQRAEVPASVASDADDIGLAPAEEVAGEGQWAEEVVETDEALDAEAVAEDDVAAPAPDAPASPQAPLAQHVRQRAADTARGVAARARRLASDGWRGLRAWTPERWLWVGVMGLGALLRFWGLGDKPLHHDESMHAFYSYLFARNPASYEYLPLLHGPFQFHAVGIFFALVLALEHLFGAATAAGNPWINDTTARIVPALFGVGIVALPLGLRRELGKAGALIAALLLAVSPSFVYFSRFLREDIYFTFFMFAIVVCAVRFAHDRKLRWLVGCIVATVLAYATFEGTFIALAIFGSFLALLVVWELAHGLAGLLPKQLTERERRFFSRAGLLLLLGLIGSLLAYFGLHTLNQLSTTINKQQAQSDAQVQRLEDATALGLLYVCVVFAVVVIAALLWQVSRDSTRIAVVRSAEDWDEGEDENDVIRARPRRWLMALREKLDPREQPLLRLLLSTSWEHWFVAAVAGWMLFVALFWIVPPGPNGNLTWSQGFMRGIGRGIWEGLYYWLQQQQVARGGQPVYYYLLLLPLYEQLVVVFGLIGVAYALARPTRFRLFLVWWFAGSLVLYSWAGEKMPWLSIHILLPLVLLAALVLDWVWRECARLAQQFLEARAPGGEAAAAGPGGGVLGFLLTPALLLGSLARGRGRGSAPSAPLPAHTDQEGLAREPIGRAHSGRNRSIAAVAGAIAALLLLVPMVHSMWLLSYKDAANGPLEMMVYVQTTDDVDLVMNKITQAAKATSGGQNHLRIWVGQGEEWPFYWYLHDYYLDPLPDTYAHIPADINQPFSADNPAPDVLMLMPSDADTFLAAHPNYHAHQYKLRSWWDEAYKPPPCQASPGHSCPASANWGAGVGLGNYLSYGSYPPPNAHFDLGRATGRLWAWLWQRQPLGETGGSYDFVFLVRDGLPIQP